MKIFQNLLNKGKGSIAVLTVSNLNSCS